MSFAEVHGGTAYEKYSKQVFETFLRKQGSKLRNCQHDIKLMGRSQVRHQIDVYFEREEDGVWKKYAIECKNYASRVEIGRVRDFWAAIEDIGDINGIFMAKSGYQIGAIRYGTHKQISLKELRLPEMRDWDGRVKSISFEIVVIDVKVTSRKFEIDNEWAAANLVAIKECFPGEAIIKLPVKFSTTDKIFLDEQNTPVASVQDVEKEIFRAEARPVGIENYHFDISKYFVMVEGKFAFKMKSLSSEVQVNEPQIEKYHVESEVDCVLKDIQTGNIDFFTEDSLRLIN